MPNTTIKIDGVEVSPAQINCWPATLNLRLGGYSQLSCVRRRGTLPANDFDLINKDVQILIDDVLMFSGLFTARRTDYSTQGWVTTFQAFDLRYKADKIPFIDSNTQTDIALFNAPQDHQLYFASRSGMTVGEVVQACLEMSTIAGPIHEQGVGGYTVSGDTFTLPANTLSDLALLDLLPPQPLQVSGAKALTAIESFVNSVYADVFMFVDPNGVIRFIRKSNFVEETLTLNNCDDLVMPPNINVDIGECYGAVELLGQPRTESKWLSLSNGGLVENFTVGSWTPADWEAAKQSRASGSCTITDTLTVVIHHPGQSWGADELDQSHLKGTLAVSTTVVSGFDSVVTREIISNTASSGDYTTVTLDQALPATDFVMYKLYALNTADALVYRSYKITDSSIIEKLAREFNPPITYINSAGTYAQQISTPMGYVTTSSSEIGDSGISLDLDGTVIFNMPTYIKAGYQVPVDVGVWVPVNSGTLSVRKPAVGFEGTAYTLCGVENVLKLYQNDWKDPGQMASQGEYAQHVLDSVKDVVIDMDFNISKLWNPGLTLGKAIKLARSGFDEVPMPITNVNLTWNIQNAAMHTTSISCSNRTQAQPKLLPPERQSQGYTWGSSEVISPFTNDKQEGGL